MASLVPPPTTPVADGASVETLIPPRVSVVGVTVLAAAAAGARVAARGESMGAPPMTTGEGVPSGLTADTGARVAARGESVGAPPMNTGEGVPSGLATDTGEGVGVWATAVGSAVGVLVGEGVLSGAGVGTDVFGDVG